MVPLVRHRTNRSALLNLLLLAVAAAAFLVIVLATRQPAYAYTFTIGDCNVSDSEAALDSAELELLRLVNKARMEHGVQPLEPQMALNRWAAWKGRDRGERYQLYTVLDSQGKLQPHGEPLPPDGVVKRDFYERAVDCGHTDWYYIAENSANGVPLKEPQAVFDAWWNSTAGAALYGPGGYHRMNILKPEAKYTGIARVRVVKPSEQNMEWFWVQNFDSEPDPPNIIQATATPPAPATPVATATPFNATFPTVLNIGPGITGRFWTGNAVPASAFANTFPSQVRAVYQWDNTTQKYRYWFRDVGIGTLTGISPGAFVFFDSSASAAITQGTSSFTLPPGAAFVTMDGLTGALWLGQPYAAADLSRALPAGVTSVVTWDEESQSFRFWLRNAPASANTITTVAPGRYYFFEGPGGLIVSAP